MKSARNALYIFAPILVVVLPIHVAYAHNFFSNWNAPLGDVTGINRDGESSAVIERPGGGIKEVIADEFISRYLEWKREFLSTEIGRRQWEFYARHPSFLVTITVSEDVGGGARTNQYQWDESDEMTSATITLGSQIDKGFPEPAYYPVINALKPTASSPRIGGRILAAAKIAHEFGHLNRAVSASGALYRLQSRLTPVYNSIFQNNGFDTEDPRLIEVAREMGGTPVEIQADGEYWGEVNAMQYLGERISKESHRRWFVSRFKENIKRYATCRERFQSLINRNDFISSRSR